MFSQPYVERSLRASGCTSRDHTIDSRLCWKRTMLDQNDAKLSAMKTHIASPVRSQHLRKRSRPVPRTRRATVLGTGKCVPHRIIDNAYFSHELGIDTTPEWIESRIGIIERYWA